MSIGLLRRLLLCFFALVFLGLGTAGFLIPARLAAMLHLLPVTLAGIAELRALYGGAFLGFGIVLLLGMRDKTHGPGMLRAMAIILGLIATARLSNLVLNHQFQASDIALEYVMALCAYAESRARPAVA